MKEQIKQLRVKLDGLAQLTKELKPIVIREQLGLDGKYFNDYKNTVQIEKAYDSLILAKAWLGKVLGELNPKYCIAEYDIFQHIKKIVEYGDDVDFLTLKAKELGQNYSVIVNTPYANDGNRKTVEDIEPTQDVSGPVLVFEDFNHIEKVDWLRQEIEKLINIVKQISLAQQPDILFSREFSIARTNSYNHLCEARFWLGFELQRIKES